MTVARGRGGSFLSNHPGLNISHRSGCRRCRRLSRSIVLVQFFRGCRSLTETAQIEVLSAVGIRVTRVLAERFCSAACNAGLGLR